MSRGFLFLATVSAATCLALASLTLRSLGYIDHWMLPIEHADSDYRAIHLEGGRLEWQRAPFSWNLQTPAVTHYLGVDIMQNVDVLLRDSYHIRRDNAKSIDGMVSTGTTVSVPLWPAILLTAILPATALWRRHRSQSRRRAGHCQHCGYDLRATPDRCPECGHVPAGVVG